MARMAAGLVQNAGAFRASLQDSPKGAERHGFWAGHARGNQVQRCMDGSPFGGWSAGEFAPSQSLGLSAICPICSQKQPGNGHCGMSQERKFQATYAAIDVTRRLLTFCLISWA